MIYTKKVKVSKQGGTSITLPAAFCEMLQIKPGQQLELNLDTETKTVTMAPEPLIQIFKIQRPLAYGQEHQYLVYNEDKSIIDMMNIPELGKLFGEYEYKVYVTGYVDEDLNLVVVEKIEEQEW